MTRLKVFQKKENMKILHVKLARRDDMHLDKKSKSIDFYSTIVRNEFVLCNLNKELLDILTIQAIPQKPHTRKFDDKSNVFIGLAPYLKLPCYYLKTFL